MGLARIRWVRKRAGRKGLVGLVILSLISCGRGAYELSGIVRVQEYALGSRVGGSVVEVVVLEGQTAKKGELLARLDDSKLLAQKRVLEESLAGAEAQVSDLKAGATKEEIDRARAELAGAEAQYRQALSGFREEDIAAAQKEVSALQAQYEEAEKGAERVLQLYQEGAVSASDRDAAIARRDALLAQLDAARERVAKLTAGLRPEEIAVAEAGVAARKAVLQRLLAGATPNQLAIAEARVRQVRAEIARLELDIADLSIFAPADGVVEAVQIHPGEIAPPGKPILSFLAVDDLWIDLYVPESSLGRVNTGTRLTLIADPYPEQPFEAEVFYISREAEFTPRNIYTPEERINLVYRVKAKPLNPPVVLRAGMNVKAILPRR